MDEDEPSGAARSLDPLRISLPPASAGAALSAMETGGAGQDACRSLSSSSPPPPPPPLPQPPPPPPPHPPGETSSAAGDGPALPAAERTDDGSSCPVGGDGGGDGTGEFTGDSPTGLAQIPGLGMTLWTRLRKRAVPERTDVAHGTWQGLDETFPKDEGRGGVEAVASDPTKNTRHQDRRQPQAAGGTRTLTREGVSCIAVEGSGVGANGDGAGVRDCAAESPSGSKKRPRHVAVDGEATEACSKREDGEGRLVGVGFTVDAEAREDGPPGKRRLADQPSLQHHVSRCRYLAGFSAGGRCGNRFCACRFRGKGNCCERDYSAAHGHWGIDFSRWRLLDGRASRLYPSPLACSMRGYVSLLGLRTTKNICTFATTEHCVSLWCPSLQAAVTSQHKTWGWNARRGAIGLVASSARTCAPQPMCLFSSPLGFPSSLGRAREGGEGA